MTAGTPLQDTPTTDDPREALAEQLVGATSAGFEALSVWLGLRLDLYAALDDGSATAGELADRAGVDGRYAREWLEHQAVAGIVAVDDAAAEPDARRYSLTPAQSEVLLDVTSPFHAAPMALALASVASVLGELRRAYRTGVGVDFAAYGDDIRDHIVGMNRPMFVHELADLWVPAVPGLAQRLVGDPPARVLDVACGSGWSSVCLARGYPKARVDGLDMDATSIERARHTAAEAGVADRVTFRVADAADPGLDGPYDAAMIFEALHDMAQPVAALAAIRQRLTDDGVVLIGDERAAETFTAPGSDLDRLFYGFSVLHCLPAGRTQTPSAATGTVLRPDTLRDYAHRVGFAHVDVLDVDNDFWRFYRLAG